MNWPNLALTKAQQAPPWPPPSTRHAVRSLPVKTASSQAQLKMFIAAQTMNAPAITLRTLSSGVAKRLRRTLPMNPTSLGGGGSGSFSSVETKRATCSSMIYSPPIIARRAPFWR